MTSRPRFTDLASVIANDDADSLRAYLVATGDLSRADDEGETLLHVAARYVRLEIAAVLLASGASAAAANAYGERPLDVLGAVGGWPWAAATDAFARERDELAGVLAAAAGGPSERAPRLVPRDSLPLTPVVGGDAPVMRLAVAPDGTTAAAEDAGGTTVFRLADGTISGRAGGGLVGLAGRARLVHRSGHRLRVVDLASGVVAHERPIHAYREVHGATVSADGTMVAVVHDDLVQQAYDAYDALVRVCYDTRDGQMLWRQGDSHVPEKHHWTVVGFAAAGSLLLGLHRDGIATWSTLDGSRVAEVAVRPAAERADWRPCLRSPLVVARDGLVLDVTVTGDGLEVLDARTLARVRALHVAGRLVRPLAVSSDGSRAATVGAGEALLWDLERGTCTVLEMPPDTGAVTCAVFAPGGELLVGTNQGAVLAGQPAPPGPDARS